MQQSSPFFVLSLYFIAGVGLIYFWLAIPAWLFGIIDMMEPL